MAAVFDLNYRVARVRFWTQRDVFMTPLGCQFVFRHRVTGEEVEGDVVNAPTGDAEDVDVNEFVLEDDEAIVAVHGCDNNYDWAVELETNTGRKFRAGGETLTGETRRAPPGCEVRGIVCPPGQQLLYREPVYASSANSELYKVIFDPNYRVAVLRLWSAGTHFDGCQFVYRHRETGHEVEGEAMLTDKAKSGEALRLEIDLLEGEYLRGLEGREGAWTDAVEVATSLDRRFRVGGSGGDIFNRTSWEMELRGISCEASDVIRNVAPIYAPPHATDSANKRVQEFGFRTKGEPKHDTDPSTLLGDLSLNQGFRVAGLNVWSVDGALCGLQVVYGRIGTAERVPDVAIMNGSRTRENAELNSCELADDEVLIGLNTTRHLVLISTSAGCQLQLLGPYDSIITTDAPVDTEIRGLDTSSLPDVSAIKPVIFARKPASAEFCIVDANNRVSRIKFWGSKKAVYGYEITYRNIVTGAVYTTDAVKAEHLDDDVAEIEYELFPAEYITGVSDYQADGTNGVEIKLSSDRSLQAGCCDGTQVVAITVGNEIEIRGFLATVGATVSNFVPIRMRIPSTGELSGVHNDVISLSGDINILSAERDRLLSTLSQVLEKLFSYGSRVEIMPVACFVQFGALVQDVKEALNKYVASDATGEQDLAASLKTLVTRAESLDQTVDQTVRAELETLVRLISSMRPSFNAEKVLAVLRVSEFVAPLGQTLKLAEDIEDADGLRCLPDDLCGAFYSMQLLVQVEDFDKFKTPDLRPFLGGGSSAFESMFAAYQNFGLMWNQLQQCVAKANGQIPDDGPEASAGELEELADAVRDIAMASYLAAVGAENVEPLLKDDSDVESPTETP